MINVGGARPGAADVDHEQPERAPDRGVRPVAGTEDAEGAVEADPGTDRAVHDDQRRGEVRRGGHAVQVERRVTRALGGGDHDGEILGDRKSTRLNSSHGYISYAVFCLKKKKTK